MKVRILTDTIPAWLVGPLLDNHEAELVVGADARAELERELWPEEPAPRARRGGLQPGHKTGARTHGRESTYVNGCRCDLCREAARLGRRRRKAS